MTEHAAEHLGRFGVWRTASQVTPELAAWIEELGFGALWLGGSPGGDLMQAERLIDALVAHGSAGQVAARLTEHIDAGADHVCLQLLTPPGADPRDGYRQLAQALRL